ncbi:hypothetical protein [Thermosipho sp. 1074]|uniref:hypothetical protein n=1 Tax=Thermosipho sp. 1074 TaxID=1643331 RepID=UPI000985DF6C|nr:hypothetical protein [Thermosipho sp. 1074]OOC42195.1 hypothetical protein XO08_07900 [Thermosipho sp. 1074]
MGNLIKTNYGLIYNDDGSLCVTVREDDIPFPGVKSFAVEEGTKNLLITNGWSTQGTKITDMSQLPSQPPVTPVIASYVPGGGNWQDLCQYATSITLAPGESITFSAWVYAKYATNYFNFNASVNGVNSGLGSYQNLQIGWNYIEGHWTNNSGASQTLTSIRLEAGNTANWRNGDNEAWGCNYQLELKPFATSFVEGTRQDGRFYIPINKLAIDPAKDNWVVAYWKKPIATHDGTLTNGDNSSCFGRYVSDYSVGYIIWGKRALGETLRLAVVWADNTISIVTKPIDLNWYFNNWHFEVVRKTDTAIEYFVDGIKQLEIALSKQIQNFDTGLFVGGHANDTSHNSLYSNLFIGKAKDTQGNLIWTDKFIQEVYNAKKPFAVPPRIPVI